VSNAEPQAAAPPDRKHFNHTHSDRHVGTHGSINKQNWLPQTTFDALNPLATQPTERPATTTGQTSTADRQMRREIGSEKRRRGRGGRKTETCTCQLPYLRAIFILI